MAQVGRSGVKPPPGPEPRWTDALVWTMLGGIFFAGFGSVFGSAGAFIGALMGVVLGLAYGGLRPALERIKRLADEVSQLKAALAAQPEPASKVEAPSRQSGTAPVPAAPDLTAAGSAARTAAAPPAAARLPAAKTTPPRPPAYQPAIVSPARKTNQLPSKAGATPARPEWMDTVTSWFQRGNPLARTGIMILFLGAAFLAKYAVDHDMFPLELRLILLAVGGIVLLGVGWRLRSSRRPYALLLQGGGVGVLYLTVFASLRLYQLIPSGPAFVLLVAISLAAAALAIAENALVLAVAGFAGGFAAPVLTSGAEAGAGSSMTLFTYYALVNLGVFAVAWFRAWRVLNLVGFVFTFVVTSAWRATSYTDADLVTIELFLLLFFVLYVAVSILFALRQPPDLKDYVSGTLVFGLPVVVFGLQTSLVRDLGFALAWSSLGLGIFYLVVAWTLFRTKNPNLRLLSEAFAALGVVFGTLAVPLAFDPQTVSAIWAVEGAGLLWLGVRQNRKLARAGGALLQLLAGISYWGIEERAGVVVLNARFLGALGLSVTGLLSAWWLHRARDRLADHERHWDSGFVLWAIAWWLYAGIADIARSVTGFRYGAVLSFMALTIVLWHLISRLLSWQFPDRIVGVLAALSLVVGLASAGLHPLGEGGAFGWPLFAIAYYWWLYRQDTAGQPQDWMHALGLWWMVLFVGFEASWQIGQRLEGVWYRLPWLLVPALALWAVGKRLPRWPVARRLETYQIRGAVPVLALGALMLVVLNLGDSGAAEGLPYVPLLNPLDVSVMLFGLAAAVWWLDLTPENRADPFSGFFRLPQPKSNGSEVLATPPPVTPSFLPPAIVAALAFLWLNSALIRALHHALGTPIDPLGIMESFPVQAAISILWGVLGFTAMILATRRGWRIVWLAGAALMGAVVVKLFVIDLAGSGSLARVVSFLSVGTLLLVTGYFSPLPPTEKAN